MNEAVLKCGNLVPLLILNGSNVFIFLHGMGVVVLSFFNTWWINVFL